MNEAVEKVFEQIKYECRPDKDENWFESIFETFFGGSARERHNFVGGINDTRNTLHENLFQAMYPDLKPQVHFGTGKGGYEKYLAKRYTADFYDEEKNIIFEIDGNNHKTERNIIKDKIRNYFFYNELGIKTMRFTNKEVENMVINRLEKMYETGEYDELFNY